MKDYEFKGDPIVPVDVPLIGNLVYDERGEEVLAIHNERFKGVKNIEDTTKYKKGQPISYPNTPRVLSYEQILRERFPDMHVLSPEEVIQYWDAIPERSETYADTNSIAVYPNRGYNEDLRQRVIAMLGKKKTEIPLAVSGLGVERADNNQGFRFTETAYTKAKEAPYLQRDGKISYNGTELIQSEEGILIWIPDDQSGFRGLCRYGSDWLNAGNVSLLSSFRYGRVQILYNPQGRAENLETRLEQLK